MISNWARTSELDVDRRGRHPSGCNDAQCRASLLTHFWSLEKLAIEPCLKTVFLTGRAHGRSFDWHRRHLGRSSSPIPHSQTPFFKKTRLLVFGARNALDLGAVREKPLHLTCFSVRNVSSAPGVS